MVKQDPLVIHILVSDGRCAGNTLEIASSRPQGPEAETLRRFKMPNPASNSATLVLTEPLSEGGSLLIYDAVGARVASIRVPADQQRVDVDLGSVAVGLYLYIVRSAFGVVGEGKLSITR